MNGKSIGKTPRSGPDRVLLGKSYRSLPVIGLVVVLLSACAFGAIAEDVLRRDSLVIYDSLLGKWLLNQTTPAGGDIFYTITLLGSATVVEIGVAVLGLWLAWKKRWLYLSNPSCYPR